VGRTLTFYECNKTKEKNMDMIPEKLIEKVLSQIDPEELINLTSNLVKINSVWDPDAGTGEQPAGEYVFNWARQQGLDARMDQVAPARPNVYFAAGTGRAYPHVRRTHGRGHPR
jgi:hypothetical protein